MRFYLIDRIDAWEPYRRIAGRKVTSIDEEYWRPGPTGQLVMPPALILEAVCQLAAWLIMLSSGFGQRAVLASIGQVECSSDVVPGDVLDVTATITSTTNEAAVIDGHATTGGRPILHTSGVICALRAADTLDDPESSRHLARQLLRREAP